MSYLLETIDYLFHEFTRLNSVLVIFLFNLLVFAKIANSQQRTESKLKTYRYFTYTQACLILLCFTVNILKATKDNIMGMLLPLLMFLIITVFGIFKIRQEEKTAKNAHKSR